ncbi:MAG: RHS domain-containing protein [Acidobacteria bacterium]|nr:RHS domain-containing protein [Acidobacteriota bacterium]
MTNIVSPADSTTIGFTYDNANRPETRTFPNGVTTTYTFDNMSRLKRLKDTSQTATLFDRQYEYDNASRIGQITEPGKVRNFSYDFVNRLTGMTSPTEPAESYNFDPVGNRLSSHRSANYGYEFGQFNRVNSTDTAGYVYDANGNIRMKAEGKELWRYQWDFDNRLVSASTRKQTVRYKYDALGRRIQRFIVGGKENTKFIYDGADVIADDNSGTLTKYLNGPGIDDKLRMQTGSDVRYFIADHLGSTNALTDSSGNVTSSATYDSFGNATGNLATRYKFTGREYDDFTGLHYYRARWYDGNLGRFISEDPIGFAGGDVNLYGYVGNGPVNSTDPLA